MNFKKVLLSLILSYVCITALKAQNVGSENVLGTNYVISSKSLQEDREIQIYVPDSYKESKKNYPVLYILDGQRLFPYCISLLKSFTQFKQTPEFIVVGITNKYPNRFSHFTDEEKNFLRFMEQEVISFVDTHFRTSNERLLFGWEYGGSFVIQTMLDRPQLFDAYLAASPYPIDEKMEDVATFLSKNKSFDKSVYFSVSTHEGSVNEGVHKLDSLLRVKAPKEMIWTYKKLENEEHRSTSYSTIYHGIKHFYFYYQELQFNNLDEFTKSGGLDYVYDYYTKRAQQFGFSKDVSQWTKFSLMRNAITANDYTQFHSFMSKLNTHDFFENLRGGRPFEITSFYIKNKKYLEALELYEILLKKRPNSKRLLNKLGDLHLLMDNNKEASRYFKKAERLPED